MTGALNRTLARLGLMRYGPANLPPIQSSRSPDMVLRPIPSSETTAHLGVMHEIRCKHCPWKVEIDTLESCLERARVHAAKEHGILLDRMREVPLGEEDW